MHAFIGWSSQRGLKTAEALRAWLRAGIPELESFVSPELPKGRAWFRELEARLAKARLGLMCLAPPNVAGEWQLIEAGAIWKAAKKGGLFPICFGVDGAEVPAPLREFQLIHFEASDFERLARGVVEAALGKAAWNEPRRQAFAAAWPALQQAVEAALAAPDPAVRTPRGFIHEVAGGWWERLIADDDSTQLSWMRMRRSDDGARLSIEGNGYGGLGQATASWQSAFVSITDLSTDCAKLRYYWEGRHLRGSSARVGGVGDLSFLIEPSHRVWRGEGEFTEVCLTAAREPRIKAVQLRRASEAESAVMNSGDPRARRDLLRQTLEAWDG